MFSGRKITSSRPAWDTKEDPVLEKKEKKKEKKKTKKKDFKKGVGNKGNWVGHRLNYIEHGLQQNPHGPNGKETLLKELRYVTSVHFTSSGNYLGHSEWSDG